MFKRVFILLGIVCVGGVCIAMEHPVFGMENPASLSQITSMDTREKFSGQTLCDYVNAVWCAGRSCVFAQIADEDGWDEGCIYDAERIRSIIHGQDAMYKSRQHPRTGKAIRRIAVYSLKSNGQQPDTIVGVPRFSLAQVLSGSIAGTEHREFLPLPVGPLASEFADAPAPAPAPAARPAVAVPLEAGLGRADLIDRLRAVFARVTFVREFAEIYGAEATELALCALRHTLAEIMARLAVLRGESAEHDPEVARILRIHGSF